VTLETYQDPGELYLTRGAEVNPLRPLFTGDVFGDVAIPGVQDSGMAMIVAHPCSMRGASAVLRPTILVVAVEARAKTGPGAWARGHFDETPLPDLLSGSEFFVGRLDELGRARTVAISAAERVACLSQYGVNLLQQRLVWYLTRLELATHVLNGAFSHTYEEADLLEEWSDTVVAAGRSVADASALFDAFIRADRGSGRTYQEDLQDPQRRSSVRTACRAEADRVAAIRNGS
jgi:hypothetical protein